MLTHEKYAIGAPPQIAFKSLLRRVVLGESKMSPRGLNVDLRGIYAPFKGIIKTQRIGGGGGVDLILMK
jgi:hypothetical protein